MIKLMSNKKNNSFSCIILKESFICSDCTYNNTFVLSPLEFLC